MTTAEYVSDGINWADADCHYGDHHWSGGVCSNCGKQLRCYCGQFVTVEGLDKHLEESCPKKWLDDVEHLEGQ